MSASTFSVTGWQQLLLVVLRLSLGWHLFFQGLGKLWEPGWTARGYLRAAWGPFAPLFHRMAESSFLLSVADQITIWGLMIAGFLLLCGLFTRIAALGGFLLVMSFFLAAPPVAYQGFLVTSLEGTELYVNKTLIEALALLVVLAFPTGQMAGLDILVRQWRERRQRRDGEPRRTGKAENAVSG